SILYRYLTFFKSLSDLIIQINTVGHQYDLWILDFWVCGDQLSKHDHGQGLAATLRMPDYAAFSQSFMICFHHLIQCIVYRKILLVSGYFFDTIIIQGEV